MSALPPLVPQSPVVTPLNGSCVARDMRLTASPAEAAFPHLEGQHPCFSSTKEGHAKSARLHLPVSPGCNITCAFCKRDFNGVEHRPGVTSRLLTPEQALDIVHRALELCPTINVIGIAGPGDPLFTSHARRTFELVHAAYPSLIMCLSTNGLMLPERAAEVIAVGVRTVTVTVNAVDPAIQAVVSPVIAYQRRRLEGVAAAQRLIDNQLAGIAAVAGRGATVKINTVLIPGLNDAHIETVARATAAAGATMINIIPLIPQHHLAHLRPPSASALHCARKQARQHLKVFEHCQRCRADACGVPGVSDFAPQLYGDSLAAEPTFSHG